MVISRYFYSIRHIEVGGRCVCNGHASHCSPTYEGKLRCRCQHNTDGDQCEKCEGLYNQKLWQPASIDNRNECESMSISFVDSVICLGFGPCCLRTLNLHLTVIFRTFLLAVSDAEGHWLVALMT